MEAVACLRSFVKFVCSRARLDGCREQMTASGPSLRLISSSSTACWSPECAAPAHGRSGLCGPCELVYRATLALYHALRARELVRMEPAAPGIARIAHRVLVARLLELAPSRDLADADLFSARPLADGRPVVGWQLGRLEAFIAELRAAAVEAEAPR
jgi:hypothetical protein